MWLVNARFYLFRQEQLERLIQWPSLDYIQSILDYCPGLDFKRETGKLLLIHSAGNKSYLGPKHHMNNIFDTLKSPSF